MGILRLPRDILKIIKDQWIYLGMLLKNMGILWNLVRTYRDKFWWRI